MSDAVATTKPRGLFNRETKGLSTTAVTVRLERGRMLFFARQLNETEPLFTDVAAARAAGHPDIAAAPSFTTVIEASAREEQQRLHEPSLMQLVGCDFRYLLHGEQSYRFRGLMYAGEEVEVTTKVVDFYDKRDGLLEFVVLESIVAHAERGMIVQAAQTLLHRLG